MMAYCIRWRGLGAMLAPTSQITTGPWKVGKMTAIPGRSTPASVRIRNWAAATQAPVLPAEITTSASPLAAILHITAIELLGLLRIASTGGSSISITWVVGTIL